MRKAMASNWYKFSPNKAFQKEQQVPSTHLCSKDIVATMQQHTSYEDEEMTLLLKGCKYGAIFFKSKMVPNNLTKASS